MMERVYCFFINQLVCLLYRRSYLNYIKVNDLEKIQKEVLINIINKNRNSSYGVKHNFNQIKTVEDYQKNVSMTVYEDYIDALTLLQETGENPLFSEPTLLLEITSGSTSASKLIPYNQSLKEEFQKGLKPWIYNLYSSYKGIKWGKGYWSITPVTTQKTFTKSGIPIGFEEDSAYFGKLEQKLQNSIFAVPTSVAQLEDMQAFYFETAYYLLKCKNLTMISIWNPTYLLLLLDYMEQNKKTLIEKLASSNKKRSQEVEEALNNKKYDTLWKHLKVISCWCDANAQHYALRLKTLFPDISIQPKGLLATEGFVSLPIANEEGARLSAFSHFFEFIDTKDRKVYLSHELKEKGSYSVVITTSGGLYRYQLKDIVQVIGFSNGLPRLKFQGKEDKVSDLFGEKLSEGFVKSVIEQFGVKSFCMVAPEEDYYVLYIQSNNIPKGVDEALRQSFHYDYCRKLGQLKPLKIYKLTGNPEKEYIDACLSIGQRLGDIKPTLLYLHKGLAQFLKGEYV